MLSVLLVTSFPGLNLVLRICASGFAYIGLGVLQLFIVFGSAIFGVSWDFTFHDESRQYR
jgi:hypothetical protein